MLLRTAIIDDDPVFTKILERYISQVDFLELTGKYPDGESASSSLDFNRTNFLFLDMEMPGMSGIEFLRSLSVVPPIIVVSKEKDYGVDAFEYDSIDFLHKPVSFPRFQKAVNKAKKYFELAAKAMNNSKDSLYIRQDRMWVRIPVSEILYVKADDNDVIIRIPDKIYKTHAKLSEIFDLLPQKDFMQIHRSYLVSLPKIDKIDGGIIEINSKSIPVSKAHIKELHQRLNIV